MTPKEQAEVLVNKYSTFETNISSNGGYDFEKLDIQDAEFCAFMAAEEILTAIKPLVKDNKLLNYWNEVLFILDN